MLKKIFYPLLFLLLLTFTSCGGSGKSSSLTASITGTFTDAQVEGLKYICSSGDIGLTTSKGEYTCNEGNNVSFYINTLKLGTVKARIAMVTPYDLFPNDITSAINLARLLQSMDSNLTDYHISLDPSLSLLVQPNTVFSDPLFQTKVENDLSITMISKEQAQKVLDEYLLNNGGVVDTNNLIANISPVANSNSFFIDENSNLENNLEATDSDSDRLIFRKMNEPLHGSLSIDSDGSFIYIPELNYNGSDSFDFNASDGVDWDVSTISITLNNIPNKPLFTSNDSLAIDENTFVNFQINAVDLDGLDITYTLSGADSGNFTLDLNTGLLESLTELDYEVKTNYSLIITASNATLESTQAFSINVSNLIDTKPSLLAGIFNINENTLIGSVVGSISVNKVGDSPIVSYRIDSNDFVIDNNGQIRTNALIDYELTSFYILDVYASNAAGESDGTVILININDIFDPQDQETPLLVVVMNWDDYSENDPLSWSNKIFNSQENSVNVWLDESTQGEHQLVPVNENSGTLNDGIIFVNMGKNHPGGDDDEAFKTEIKNALSSAEVDNNVNFKTYDTNDDGQISTNELQILMIVAGGEEATGDSVAHSIWAHSWSLSSTSDFKLDDVYLLRFQGDRTQDGGYVRIGANHRLDNDLNSHQATIGIIAHELSHSLFDLNDYYGEGSSGLGWYDIMSSGSWAYKSGDTYTGQTPTQFSIYSKLVAQNIAVDFLSISSSQEITINCSSKDVVKLETNNANEYFLIECRDTAKINSDIALNIADNRFGENKLFALVYHIDEGKSKNEESGPQDSNNHYKVRILEKDKTILMTDINTNIDASLDDVYVLGDRIESVSLPLYNGIESGYSIEVTQEDYINRTMTLNIEK